MQYGRDYCLVLMKSIDFKIVEFLRVDRLVQYFLLPNLCCVHNSTDILCRLQSKLRDKVEKLGRIVESWVALKRRKV